MEQHTHYFYALELTQGVKRQLESAVTDLRKQFLFKSWVHPEDYHITLAFLGNAPLDQLDKANRLVGEVLAGSSPFELRIDHLGTFGRKDSPRIFWAGLESSSMLGELREKVFSACLSAGFNLETRPFSPHITLARRWTGDTSFSPGQNPFQDGEVLFHAERVVLYRTHMGKSPKYEPIKLFPLAASNDF